MGSLRFWRIAGASEIALQGEICLDKHVLLPVIKQGSSLRALLADSWSSTLLDQAFASGLMGTKSRVPGF
jgi:hypothetical protein